MGEGLLSKIKVLVGIEEVDDDDEDDDELDDYGMEKNPPSANKRPLDAKPAYPQNRIDSREVTGNKEIRPSSNAPVVSKMNGNTSQFKMVVIEPEGFKDSEKLVDNLKAKKPVIINLEKLESDVARKIFDFLSGATFALDGHVQKVANNIFLFTPANVDVGTSIDHKSIDFNSGSKNQWK